MQRPHKTLFFFHSRPRYRSTEFSDQEISSAFKFLDLDHNLHIGAAEIRHILICMGELITDEEVRSTLLRVKHAVKIHWVVRISFTGSILEVNTPILTA